jgi:hypothetical protein
MKGGWSTNGLAWLVVLLVTLQLSLAASPTEPASRMAYFDEGKSQVCFDDKAANKSMQLQKAA